MRKEEAPLELHRQSAAEHVVLEHLVTESSVLDDSNIITVEHGPSEALAKQREIAGQWHQCVRRPEHVGAICH